MGGNRQETRPAVNPITEEQQECQLLLPCDSPGALQLCLPAGSTGFGDFPRLKKGESPAETERERLRETETQRRDKQERRGSERNRARDGGREKRERRDHRQTDSKNQREREIEIRK